MLARLSSRGRRLAATPLAGIAVSVLLLVASLMLGLHDDELGRAEKLREAQVQAQILAGSLAGPLAFDDGDATREYLGALAVNQELVAAGVYGPDGRLVASFRRDGAPLPDAGRVGPPVVENGELIVTAPVAQAGASLGSVYLRATTETWSRRALRYLGIATVVLLAALLIVVLGLFYASASAANRRLQAEIKGREQAEAALRQSQKMEAMGQLTGGVAHDFNNLLMVASSGLELLGRTDDPARQEKLRRGIGEAIERGAKLTQQLLTFARRSPLNPQVVDLARCIRGLHDLLDRSLREDVLVELDLPDGLWPIEVDTSQLEVAVLNVAINARDAMPHGGVIRIDAGNVPGAGGAGDMVRLTVRDTGAGIAPDMIEKVFEPFFTTKGVGRGTGLGLSQVYGFARGSGGDVTIESVPGAGTALTLFFPRSTKPLPVEPASASASASEAEAAATVLLVEDDDNVAEMVGGMLRELGYATVRSENAASALKRLDGDGGPFDLLLSDMIMPGEMDGLDLARHVARRYPDLPAVLMTGYSQAAAAVSAQGIALLTKPFTMETLGEALRQALRAGGREA